ncbi:hypothetical protein BDR06DRAFT_948605 [Suillus hirtellus]|nr:hypothetical protein BDR06DRAFT_948605 [Suillus hirtellus]
MVADGGASVVYSDAIAAARFTHELANYGEYSGGQTFEYGKTVYTGHRENAAPLLRCSQMVSVSAHYITTLTASHWNLPRVLVLQTNHGLECAPIPYMYIHVLRVTVRRYHRSTAGLQIRFSILFQ